MAIERKFSGLRDTGLSNCETQIIQASPDPFTCISVLRIQNITKGIIGAQIVFFEQGNQLHKAYGIA
jgi:hypothetical protein